MWSDDGSPVLMQVVARTSQEWRRGKRPLWALGEPAFGQPITLRGVRKSRLLEGGKLAARRRSAALNGRILASVARDCGQCFPRLTVSATLVPALCLLPALGLLEITLPVDTVDDLRFVIFPTAQ